MSGRRVARQRIAATAGLFAAIFLALITRAIQLTVLEGPALRQKAARQHTQRVSMLARRGPIVDRYGEPLALTRESAAVYMRPREVTASADTLMRVADLLELPPRIVMAKTSAPVPFVWLDRQVPLDRWSAVERLAVSGIGSEPARQRVYPHGALAGQVLGFTNIDGQGLEGVERRLDADLRGEAEALAVERDARGRRIVVDEEWRPLPRVGARVELTIDAGLQEVAEVELERAVRDFGATAGSVVILAPRTGEVLAMGVAPRFDPNQFDRSTPERWRNRTIADSYEPGSTFKAILAAEALDAGVVTPDDRIYCERGHYAIGGRVVHDHHPHGVLSFTDVIAESSNIGAGKVAERLGRDRFAAALDRFGFGRPTGIDLPGEVAGLVRPADQWGRIHLVTTAFGQGISVTPLQLARAFAAIANGGVLMRPYVVRQVVSEDGTVRVAGRPQIDGRVVSQATAQRLTEILTAVVDSGTGTQARIEGVKVAGKTGTAQKVDPVTRRYHPRARMASFVGYVPAADPELVILVVVDSPTKATYGGVVAAPVFRRIAEYGLERRGVLRRSAPARELVPEPATAPLQPANLPIEHAPQDAVGTPNLIGLGMREALVRAHRAGWTIEWEGSGYVVAQDPPAGSDAASRQLRLKFGSTTS